MRALVLLFLAFAAVTTALPSDSQRIVGGSSANIAQYPSIAALLATNDWTTWWQSCGGTILNQRSILTAAHCVAGDSANRWRVRVGSSYANSEGVVHAAQSTIIHPQYNTGIRFNNDIAILRTATNIAYLNNAVQAASIAGQGLWVPDNQAVWAAGWGATAVNGPSSEILQHVQVWSINQGTCINRYREVGGNVNQNMICTGWLDVGGRDACFGDDGGPVYYNGVVVGITSWAEQCALGRYPRVNTRVSMYTNWIRTNA